MHVWNRKVYAGGVRLHECTDRLWISNVTLDQARHLVASLCMDRVTPETRSRIMASVRTANTGAEISVRSLVHRMGYRFSLRRKDLPGKPDLTFVSRGKVIFVHGCFWHGHACKYGRLPKSKPEYWVPKIAANKSRDRRQERLLRKLGWGVMTVWQCQLKYPERLEARLKRFLENE